MNANKNTLCFFNTTAKDEDRTRIIHTARASGGLQKLELELLPASAPVMLIPEANQINQKKLEDVLGEGRLGYHFSLLSLPTECTWISSRKWIGGWKEVVAEQVKGPCAVCTL